MTKYWLLLLMTVSTYSATLPPLHAQMNEDKSMLQKIHRDILLHGEAYKWLTGLSESIGGRLAGSPESLKAVQYVHDILDTLGLDRIWNQPCTIPNYWTRGKVENVTLQTEQGDISLPCTTLGGSSGTPVGGIQAVVVEVHSLDDVKRLGKEAIQGKIVFFNRPMDAGMILSFHAYGKAVDQRVFGPEIASKYGAVACIVRSMTNVQDDVPHTGVTIFRDSVRTIPALAISTLAADQLSAWLKKDMYNVRVETHAENHGPTQSFNVIGEILGSEHPDNIIAVGGHLDAWDNGHGAHDDGAGIVQALEVLYSFKRLGYRPKNTIRFVAFMNEENGSGGAKAYADSAKISSRFHLAAIESDAGGFTPRGFSFGAKEDLIDDYKKQLEAIKPLLDAFDLYLKPGGSGADVGHLKFQGGLLLGLRPDPQRYFNYHHTAIDRIEAVNERELKMGAAAMTSLVYLLDNYLKRAPSAPKDQ